MGRILTFEDQFNGDKGIEKGDTIFVEVQYIDEGAYHFFSTLAMMGMSRANPDSNIEGGALGYFGAYSFNQATIIADWQ
jgi:hypothetical protein